MTDVADQLLELLDIEQLEVDLFRGVGSGGETTTRIFGGHVIAQALMAAYRTVPDRLCHSLHAYFIRPGDPRDPGDLSGRPRPRRRQLHHPPRRGDPARQADLQPLGLLPRRRGGLGLPARDARRWARPKTGPTAPNCARRMSTRSPRSTATISCAQRPIEVREVDPRDFFTPEKASRPQPPVVPDGGGARGRGRRCSIACSPMRPT